MGLTGFLEALIGLVFIYFLASVLCSAINEFIAQELGRRGKFLREGLINIVSDRWIYLRLINQPLISSLYRDVPGKPKTPSYIPATNFVDALFDTLLLKASQIDKDFDKDTNGSTLEVIRAAALKCKESGYTVGDAILPLLNVAKDDLKQARENVAAWYESGMERVTGWYKKYTRRLLFVIGLAVAVLFNVDTFQIATQLSSSATLRKSLADAAAQTVATKKFAGVPFDVTTDEVKIAQENLGKFAAGIAAFEQEGLPVGFSCLSPEKVEAGKVEFWDMLRKCWEKTKEESNGTWFLKIIGWLITALAISFGAPFWFDLLNKLVDLRGAGSKPQPAPGPVKSEKA